MLKKDAWEASRVSLNIKRGDGSYYVRNLRAHGTINVSLPRSESFTLENEFSISNVEEILCDISTENKQSALKDYEFLPEHLYHFHRIPPPLVLTSWLNFIDSDDDSGEDSVPLSGLRKLIRNKKTLKKTTKATSFLISEDVKSQKPYKKVKKVQKEYSPVQRSRGRPRKKETGITGRHVENDFVNDWVEATWNCESDTSNTDIRDGAEVNTNYKRENLSASITKHNEHDYFKPAENKSAEVFQGEPKIEVTAKKNSANLGIKFDNSKISFPCLDCGKSFSAASTLKCHQRIHNGTLLPCPECHKGFVSRYLLKCHMRIHTGDLFMCHKCGRGFTTAELLKVHSRAHTGDRPFVCNICGKSFPTSSNMLQHKQIHNSEKKFLCSQCGSSFVQKRCLDYHMLTHAEKKNICNVCGKLWARKSDLIEHMRVHTGVKPYCCSVCPQKFSQASSLKRHQLVHMNVKPIHCETCNKMFKCQEYYKRHFRKHMKEDYLQNDQ